LLGLDDVDDDLWTKRNVDTERRDRLGLVEDRFERVSGLDPVIVAAVEQANIGRARITKDERRLAGGDLSGSASRPFLVGMAFGIAAMEDDGDVPRDPQ
jgi:hypothetical protein